MDKQKIFNNGYRGVIAQGGFCVYRGPGERKCALGHSIPDERYHIRLELEVPSLGNELADIFGAQNQNDIDFLRNFQKIHDKGNYLESFKKECKDFAKLYQLKHIF